MSQLHVATLIAAILHGNSPTHILIPKPKGRDANTFGVSLFFLLHLSGLNISGSGKLSGNTPASLIGMMI